MSSNKSPITHFLMNKSHIQDFLKAVSLKHSLYVPTKTESMVEFKIYTEDSKVTFDYVNSSLSPKNFFLPQQEDLFSFSKEDSLSLQEDLQDIKRIIFGIRPCDSFAISLLDRVFLDDKTDVYYLNKRNNTLLLGLGCLKPQKHCSCLSFGVDPTNDTRVDIFFSELEEAYFVTVNTDAGRSIINQFSDYFQAARETDLQMVETKSSEINNDCLLKFRAESLEKFKDLAVVFEHPIWEELSETCLGCGICTYLCPTCHCFDLADEMLNGQGRRYRVWDSCQFFSFTNMTSGHNPRPTRKERLRQRFLHKLNYYFSRYQQIACSGCGRCLLNCPVDIDITRIIRGVIDEK